MSAVDEILAKCESAHLVGARPAVDRLSVQRLKAIAQKGVLALLLVAASAQAFAGAPTPPPILHQADRTAVVIEQGPAKFVDTVFTHQSPDLEWVSGHGNVDAAGMLQGWRDGGVSPNNILELTKVMVVTQSPTIARTAGAAWDAARLSGETRGIFDIHDDAQATEFLAAHSLGSMADKGVLPPEVAMIYATAESSDLDDTLAMWKSIATNHNTITPASLHATENDAGMASAKLKLLEAVDQAGLSSLTVPLPYWSSSKQIAELAANITMANQELQKVTGWAGPVLGLNGRVALTIGQPSDMAVAYVNSTTESDTLISVVGSWEYVGHEITHALDMAMRIDAGLPGVRDAETGAPEHSSTLTEVLATGHVSDEHAHNYAAWGNLNGDLKQAGLGVAAPWHAKMQEKADSFTGDSLHAQWLNSYYQRAQEQIAYSFSAHVNHMLQGDKSSTLGGAVMNHDGARTPSLEEAALAAPVWKTALNEAGQQWWTPQISASLVATAPSQQDQDISHAQNAQSQEAASVSVQATQQMGSFHLRLASRRAEGQVATPALVVKVSPGFIR